MSDIKAGDLFVQARGRVEKDGYDYAKAKTAGFDSKFKDCLLNSMKPGGTVDKQFAERGLGRMNLAYVCSDIFDPELYDRKNAYQSYLLKEYDEIVDQVCKNNGLTCQILDKDKNSYIRYYSPYQVSIWKTNFFNKN